MAEKYSHIVWQGNCASNKTRVVIRTDVLSSNPMGKVLVVEHLKKDAMDQPCWKEDSELTEKANDDESFLAMVVLDMAKCADKHNITVE